MEKSKFAAILPIIVGGLTNKIIEETSMTEDEAFEKLYNSELYTALEREETKVWYYSVHFLFDLYQDEMATGKLELPDF
ncbi:MAG: hypothetical protein FWD23_16180 [Oscillospiraceae bacterium]|nr:hypothetical protein [Oscillospiraceae bacterium]